MITVEKVQKQSKDSEKFANVVSEQKPGLGTVKAIGQSYWPWVIIVAAASAFAYWFWKKGKNNGEVSG